ncbi:MAG TPA: bifunctional phosphopantothenoylcysteine decarboxylase/phosphopantothenate--cysteine ligase CoaBC [Burkholderiaceae bacterium]|nr:bifunctional phosphopantothenoylcysteine decarboxylase/phosphopantothenate--cysteine ligase CoaBC [Burkholderiaceae bacterium]HQR71642.1 bifunctional phosphopantothenoylcysteine decarboxylase/phosphopantothenate--cysteine ligase CoaBC [Burkholderiaceae bacterium]
MDLAKKRLVVGLTGGVAAYKVCELVRRLQDEGADVQVVMTAAAQQFVTATTLQALTGKPVFTDQWGSGAQVANAMPHIDLTRGVDAIVVAPATAHFLAKTAQGLADDLLSTLVLARNRATTALLVAPAMNVEMWDNPATQRNVAQLAADGVVLLGPAAGNQACGETGLGRMLEPAELLADIVAFFQPKRLAGRRVVLTAGPTFEPIDPVRGISNLSSGKTGFALARAAAEAGAEVTLVAGPTELPTPRNVRRIDVRTALEMHDAVHAQLPADVFIAVAAVADWRVANVSGRKLKKQAGAAVPTLEFALNPDILASVAALPRAPFCVGFAAESDDVIENARAKLISKKVPLVVANRAQDTLGADESELHLVESSGVTTLSRADKRDQARRLIAAIAERLA